jgi:hypothetical protein
MISSISSGNILYLLKTDLFNRHHKVKMQHLPFWTSEDMQSVFALNDEILPMDHNILIVGNRGSGKHMLRNLLLGCSALPGTTSKIAHGMPTYSNFCGQLLDIGIINCGAYSTMAQATCLEIYLRNTKSVNVVIMCNHDEPESHLNGIISRLSPSEMLFVIPPDTRPSQYVCSMITSNNLYVLSQNTEDLYNKILSMRAVDPRIFDVNPFRAKLRTYWNESIPFYNDVEIKLVKFTQNLEQLRNETLQLEAEQQQFLSIALQERDHANRTLHHVNECSVLCNHTYVAVLKKWCKNVFVISSSMVLNTRKTGRMSGGCAEYIFDTTYDTKNDMVRFKIAMVRGNVTPVMHCPASQCDWHVEESDDFMSLICDVRCYNREFPKVDTPLVTFCVDATNMLALCTNSTVQDMLKRLDRYNNTINMLCMYLQALQTTYLDITQVYAEKTKKYEMECKLQNFTNDMIQLFARIRKLRGLLC